MNTYPKISSEDFNKAIDLVLGVIKTEKYLEKSTYSDQFREIIQERATELVTTIDENGVPIGLPEYLNNLAQSNLSEEGKDYFGSLKTIENSMVNLRKLEKSSSQDSVKMTASLKLMEMEKDKITLLEKLKGIDKVEKIEGLTRQFFRELSNTPEIKEIATRYLKLLDEVSI